jgi:hypothetical protein
MRLLVARCEVVYTGRLTATLADAVRLLVFKSDGSVLVHDDSGGYKPLNWIRREFRPADPGHSASHSWRSVAEAFAIACERCDTCATSSRNAVLHGR